MKRFSRYGHRLTIMLVTLLFFYVSPSFSQKINFLNRQDKLNKDLFAVNNCFIENKGQYGERVKGFENMGKILYAYEGLTMPVLFTEKGMIHLQRKIEGGAEAEKEREREKSKLHQSEKESEAEEKTATDRTITVEWLNASVQSNVAASYETEGYHCYGFLQEKAKGFRRVIYKEIYPGIDLVLSISNNAKPGFEYSLIVKPGANLNLVQMKYGGDVKKLITDKEGKLIVRSDIDGIEVSLPVSFYGNSIDDNKEGNLIPHTGFIVKNNVVSFEISQTDNTRTLIVDPFVSGTGNLTGADAGKAKDVDFDYNGNVFVAGGGNGTVYQLAKYNAAGVFQWVFSGTIAVPAWKFGTYYGGWVVEKYTGNVYLGQGFEPGVGHRIIRLNQAGIYDNYISNGDPNFRENWKMIWFCNNGNPQLLCGGGGTNSNINFGICTPPSTTLSSINITGIPYSGLTGWAQDVVDVIIDPLNKDIYTIYGSLFGTPSLSNKMYKNTAPYSGASVAWTVSSGFVAVNEIANRPYLAGPQIDNSANIFAINSSYLFYWDGKNLKAFDKATGAGVGTPLITGNAQLQQGGIIADECNNVFVGSTNGIIKVYKFNGTVFDDAAAPDIPIGVSGAVYDLAFDEAKKILYASGNGLVAAIDVSSYSCLVATYSINVIPDCANLMATATVTPVPPAGSTVAYNLYNGNTLLLTNSTGVFTGLTPGIQYTIIATINTACSGTQTLTTFTLPGPVITSAHTDVLCGNSNGTITVSGSNGTAPYRYSLDGITYQLSGNFSGLGSGVYIVHVKDANNCSNTVTVTILSTDGPMVSFVKTDARCGNASGTITATGSAGSSPYSYSINGTTFQANNFFTGLVSGQYTLTIKDNNGCKNAVLVSINNITGPQVNASYTATTCGNNNGSIIGFVTGGLAPLQYSINGNQFQSSNTFSNLAAGTYVLTIKDSNNCIITTPITIAATLKPSVTGSTTPAACSNANGTITATGSGGTSPYTYSVNGTFFQPNNIFTGLPAGSYTITIKDAVGCTGIATVNIASTNGPAVTVTSTSSSCAGNTGTITATGTGGITPYTYSINGFTFQGSGSFTGLLPNNYIVYVKDAGGCIGTISTTVLATAGPAFTTTITPTACSSNTGTIAINGTGGTPPYTYSINGLPFQSNNVYTGLQAGNYQVSIKDFNGCIYAQLVYLDNVSNLHLTASSISSSCSNNSNGSITAIATGGVGALQYSINGTVYQPGNVFTNLANGNYTVYVKDANNCIVTATVTVLTTSLLQMTVTTPAYATCTGSNGIIIITASGGLPPYSYSVNGTVFQSGNTFIGLGAGTYPVTVKDATGCSVTTSTSLVSSGTGPGITNFTIKVRNAYICNGGLGRISNFVVTGGSNPYTFSLDFSGVFSNVSQFTNIPIGTHYITAQDGNGCTKTISFNIIKATTATVTTTVTGTACNGTSGTITVTGVGPNTPYHISITGINGPWIDFDPTYTFTGLAPGTYTLISSDDESFDVGPPLTPGGCLDTVTVVVPATGGPTVSTTHTNGSCNLSNGTITVLAGNGTAPYTYSIDGLNFQSDSVFTDLSSGTYTVSVMDFTGCMNAVNVTVTNTGGPQISAVATSTSCNLKNGVITITVTGGAAPYLYSINGTVFEVSNVFSFLASGSYTIYVSDNNHCVSSSTIFVSANTIPKVTAFSIASNCGVSNGQIIASGIGGASPYQFSIDGIVYQSSGTFTNISAGSYVVYIRDATGCISNTVMNVTNINGPALTLVAVAEKCGNANGSITATGTGGSGVLQYSINGINFQGTGLFSGLSAGVYTITVKDANGCLATKTINVSTINGPQTLSVITVSSTCGNPNGSITATATGGTLAYQYSIDGTTYQPASLFSGLNSGNYTLSVKDGNGCIKSIPVNLINLAGPTITVSPAPATCGAADGSVTVNANGGTVPLTYSINGINFQTNNIFPGLTPGNYTITVKDTKGCTAVSPVVVLSIGGSLPPIIIYHN